MAPWIGLAVAAVMLIVIASYRQNVHAYPSGGGDYEVVTTNLGHTAGLTVASALLVDYVLTVAVSMSSAMSNIGSAVPFIAQHKVCVRCHRDPGAGVDESAWYPRVGHRVRDPDLRVHDRDVHHAGLGAVPDLCARHATARRVGGLRDAFRTRRCGRVRAGVPGRAGVLVRQCRADGCRGDQQRGAGVPETQVPQRRNDAAVAGR